MHESEEGQGLGRRRGEQREGAESKFKTQLWKDRSSLEQGGVTGRFKGPNAINSR